MKNKPSNDSTTLENKPQMQFPEQIENKPLNASQNKWSEKLPPNELMPELFSQTRSDDVFEI
jgi:hypothetical protein